MDKQQDELEHAAGVVTGTGPSQSKISMVLISNPLLGYFVRLSVQ